MGMLVKLNDVKLLKPADKARAYRATPRGRISALVRDARWRGKSLGVPVDLDVEEMWPYMEAGWCPYVQTPWDFDTPRGPYSPSIHRIIPERGYVNDNCIVISWIANCAISHFGERTFESFAYQYLMSKRPDLIVTPTKKRRYKAFNDNSQLSLFESVA